MDFRIVKGNIVDAQVDAIVLPANANLREGSGASKAIFEAAGRKLLTKKCKELAPCEVGSAVATLGYDLESKYIIHAVVPKWIDGNHNEYDLLSSAYAFSLALADEMGCKSIAFPLLASGNNGFDLNLAFEIAEKNIELFDSKNIEDVVLVVFGNRISDLVKEKGYDVGVLPRNLQKDEEELKKKERAFKLFKEAKDVAQDIAEEQLQKGIDYLKEPENREKIYNYGKKIVGMLIRE